MRRSRRLIFSSYGVPISLSFPRELEKQIGAILPPARERAPATVAPKRFEVVRHGKALVRAVEDDDEFIAEGEETAFVLDILDRSIREHIASEAPDHVFVHAGAVAVDGVALMLPGASFAGKSTLVAALVSAGATYLSDEYAVLDAAGRVVAYPRTISLRRTDVRPVAEVESAHLGQVDAGNPRPVVVVALTEYRPGATWAPERLTTGIGAMGVFENTITPVRRPERALAVIRRALEDAVVLRGPRGEASDVAPALIAEVRAR